MMDLLRPRPVSGSVLTLVLATLAMGPATATAQLQQKAEAKESTIGYPTVAAALEALRAKPGVRFAYEDSWLVVSDPPTQTLWSFTPAGHPAHPAVVKRQVVEQNGAVGLSMTVRCEATKVACEAMVKMFEIQNASLGG